MIFSFLHPQYLFLLFLIPLALAIHFFSLNNRKKRALKFANFDSIAKIQGIDFFSKNIFALFIVLIMIFLMVLAAAGLNVQVFKKASTFSFVVAIDSSQSMEANDLSPNRLEAAKSTAIDFVNKAPLGSRIGVVSFAGNSYIDNDLSNDKMEIKNVINNIKISVFGGTDLYEAVITSTNLMEDEENKAVILLSDGQINVASVYDLVDYANKKDVIVHTIAVGTKEGGDTSYGISKLDEESLKSIAYNTKGVYFSAEDKESLSQSFLDILQLTKKKVTISLGDYLILFSVFLLIFYFFITHTRYI